MSKPKCQDCKYAHPCQYRGLMLCLHHSGGFDDGSENTPELLFTKANQRACRNFKSDEE